eukprot:3968462-Pleurochrysis_carterae.AAC.1
MQTHNFDVGSPDTQEVTHSNIVARIPVIRTDQYDDYTCASTRRGICGSCTHSRARSIICRSG